MKLQFLSLAAFTILYTSCSGNEATNSSTDSSKDTTSQTTTDATIDENSDMGESSGYASEWGDFRIAVTDNNLDAFKSFLGPDVSDPEGLLMSLREDWVLNTLVETPYEDLTDSDYNGTPVKQFSATVEGSDDEGNIYESGIYLYFEEAPSGLKLVNVLMAG